MFLQQIPVFIDMLLKLVLLNLLGSRTNEYTEMYQLIATIQNMQICVKCTCISETDFIIHNYFGWGLALICGLPRYRWLWGGGSSLVLL